MVSTDLVWLECEFEEHGSLERPHVHDNFVYALSLHIEKHVLVLHTQYRDQPNENDLTDVRFPGWIAHHFDDVMESSILLDIERVPLEWVVERWQDLLLSRQSYSWPLSFTNMPDLVAQLTMRQLQGYHVMGTCGLDGFVLAKAAEYRHRNQPVDPTELD